MKPLITTATLVAIVLVVGMALAYHPTGDRVIVCNPIEYPDGERGVAVVTIAESGPPFVIAEYYGPDRVEYLGRFEDHSGGTVPFDEEQAREFAFNHYYDRHGQP
jgi:hypothetical protein